MNTDTMDCINVGIEVFPTHQPLEPPPKKVIPDKLLAILRKYKANWRIQHLARPLRVTHKYVPKEEGLLHFKKPEKIKLDDELVFYSDQLAAPALKNIMHNKILYSKINRKIRRKFTKNLNKTWNTIYNFYKKRERDKRVRQRRREQKKDIGKPKVFVRVDTLAKPKPVYKPPPPPPEQIFDSYDRLDVLASPKVYILQPPKREGVNPHALTYEPTEIVFRLAKLPKRFEKIPKALEPGVVKRSALRYKVTPRIESLSVPKTTREKAKDDDDFDPWAISKNALKYKPTPRIMELCKPREL